MQAMIGLLVNPSCIPSQLNMAGCFWLGKVDAFSPSEAAESGLALDFNQYIGISNIVLAQKFHPTARHLE